MSERVRLRGNQSALTPSDVGLPPTVSVDLTELVESLLAP